MTNLHKYNTSSSLLYPELSYKLQGAFFTVYNTLGFGHKEIAYQRALGEELKKQNIPHSRELSLPILYNKTKVADYRPDFVIDHKIIVEIKAVEFLFPKLITQLTYYLKGTHLSLGYLVNFGSSRLQIVRRIWTPNYQPKIRDNSLLIRGNPEVQQ